MVKRQFTHSVLHERAQGQHVGRRVFLLADAATHTLIEGELAKCGAGFKGYERPRKFGLLAEEFSVENGMLTPKMSLKRRIVLESYQDRVDALYG